MSSRLKIATLLIGDVIVLYGALLVTLYVRYFSPFFPSEETLTNIATIHLVPFFFVHALWILIFFSVGLYDWRHLSRIQRNLPATVMRAMTAGTLLAAALFYITPVFAITPKTNLVFDAVLVTLLIIGWHTFYSRLILSVQKTRILFLGSSDEIRAFFNWIDETPSLGYSAIQLVRTIDELPQTLPLFASSKNIDLIIVEPRAFENKALVRACYEVVPLGITVVNFAEFYESTTDKIPTSIISESWFLENLFELDKRAFESAKRFLDITVATILSIPTIIFLPLIAIAIKIDSRGPVFYYQTRIGKNGVPFYFIKFRSMRLGSDALDGSKNIDQDARQTRVGKIIRALYLDELPQIINVFRGEMSFVGPRPERPQYVDDLKKQVPFYEIRLVVKPGITGWAQINMENDASVEDAPAKLQYDLFYIKNRSFLTDIEIMIKTATLLVRRTGR